MASNDWDFLIWQRANDLLQQAERIRRNFLQVADGARYRSSSGRTLSWQPPVNVVETDESLWVISAVPGAMVILPSRNRVLFPSMIMPVTVRRPER